MKNVAWIVSDENPEQMSGYRYNAIIPAQELSARVLRFDLGDDPKQFLSHHRVDAIVICKALKPEPSSPENDSFIDLAEKCKRKGIKVCFHMSDWHFEDHVYKTLAKISDLVVVQTKWIAGEVEKHFKRTPAIIEELDELLYTNWNEKFHPIWCNLHNYQYLSFIVK